MLIKNYILKNFASLIVQKKSLLHSECVLIQKADNTLFIKLNNPNRRNSLNLKTIQTLSEVLRKFELDNDLKAVILSGSYGNFCVGIDPFEIDKLETLSCFSNLIRNFPKNKISIAALEGYTVCAGLQLALCCDFRVAENDINIFNDKNCLPLHPVLKKKFFNINLEDVLQSSIHTSKALSLGLINKITHEGCCLGVSIELANCINKFDVEPLNFDKQKLFISGTDLISLRKILKKYSFNNAKRFFELNLGKHGKSKIHSDLELKQKKKSKSIILEDLL